MHALHTGYTASTMSSKPNQQQQQQCTCLAQQAAHHIGIQKAWRAQQQCRRAGVPLRNMQQAPFLRRLLLPRGIRGRKDRPCVLKDMHLCAAQVTWGVSATPVRKEGRAQTHGVCAHWEGGWEPTWLPIQYGV